MSTITVGNDAFSPKTNTRVSLQQRNTTKASWNVIADEFLSWDQIVTAQGKIIAAARAYGWPEKHTTSLAEFYMNLGRSAADGTSPRTLVRYHAIARRLWHSFLEGRRAGFNLSVINEKLLANIENQIRDEDLEELQNHASHSLILLRTITNKFLSTPLHYTDPPLQRLCQLTTQYCVTSPPQSGMLSDGNTVEAQSRDRNRERTRKRGRGRGRQRSSRSRSPRDKQTGFGGRARDRRH